MKASIVIGLGFGDEGKGLMTSLLASKHGNKALVVRFNGGHQAGHTVVKDNIKHTFSNFGAGTLHGSPTYWSRFCTFDPIGALNELRTLNEYGTDIKPLLYIHPLCPVVTPFDKLWNMQSESMNGHGSVGVGFGATLARHEKYFKLYVQDLFYPDVLLFKMKNIGEYYMKLGLQNRQPYATSLLKFMNDIDCFKAKTDVFKIRKPRPMDYHHIVFEGAQGVMLDMDYGFFPNVTRSNTTSKNALEMINEMAIPFVEMYYMTRAYQTRHGNGAMTGEKYSDLLKLQNIEGETNVMNEYQGSFRKAPLDLNLLEYALNCDKIHSGNVSKKNIVITCLDQVNEDEIVVNEGNDHVTMHSLEALVNQEVFRNYKVFANYDPAGNTFCDARSVGVLN